MLSVGLSDMMNVDDGDDDDGRDVSCPLRDGMGWDGKETTFMWR